MAKKASAKASVSPMKMENKKMENKWRDEDNARVLVKAQEILADKDLKGGAMTCLNRQHSAMQKAMGMGGGGMDTKGGK